MRKRRTSTHDVARYAGVSQATVSYVLTERADKTISPETRELVLNAARELGYYPNSLAKALRTGRTHLVALWVPNAHSAVFGNVIRHTMRQAEADNQYVLVGQSRRLFDDAGQVKDILSGVAVDGIIAHDSAQALDTIDAAFGLQNFPVPLVSVGPEYTERTDYVGVDLYDGSRQAVQHLLDIGCSRITYVAREHTNKVGDPRHDAYVSLMQENHRIPDVFVLSSLHHDQKARRQAVSTYLRANARTDGLFCLDDETAIAANAAARDLGIRVPADMAIIGSDGIDDLEYQVPSLSTVAQPIEEMCRLAWQFLQKRISDPSVPRQQVILPMQLIIRDSTRKEP